MAKERETMSNHIAKHDAEIQCNSEHPECQRHPNFALGITVDSAGVKYWVSAQYGACDGVEIAPEHFDRLVQLQRNAHLDALRELLENAFRSDDCDNEQSALSRMLARIEGDTE